MFVLLSTLKITFNFDVIGIPLCELSIEIQTCNEVIKRVVLIHAVVRVKNLRQEVLAPCMSGEVN